MDRLIKRSIAPVVLALGAMAIVSAITVATLKAMAGDWGYVVILVVLSTPVLVIVWLYRRADIQSMKDRGL